MKKIILLIEDVPEEQAVAKEVIFTSSCKAIVAENLSDALRLMKKMEGKINGILTDLHFPENDDPTYVEKTGKNPNGLVIITKALLEKIPVSVCSSVNHHFCQYLKAVVEDLEKITGKKIPFTLDRKDWSQAMQSLAEIMEDC